MCTIQLLICLFEGIASHVRAQPHVDVHPGMLACQGDSERRVANCMRICRGVPLPRHRASGWHARRGVMQRAWSPHLEGRGALVEWVTVGWMLTSHNLVYVALLDASGALPAMPSCHLMRYGHIRRSAVVHRVCGGPGMSMARCSQTDDVMMRIVAQ